MKDTTQRGRATASLPRRDWIVSVARLLRRGEDALALPGPSGLTTFWPALRGALCGIVWLAAGIANAGITNGVPWSDTFEAYSDGFPVAGTNGWWADNATDGTATTNPAALGALATYLSGGGTDPLPALTNTTVLQTVAEVRNEIRSATGGVVVVDFLALPVPVDTKPADDPDRQCMFYVAATNGHVVIWHWNTPDGVNGTNQWLDVTPVPALATGVWTRFTVRNDYGHNLYQVSVNGTALSNAVGWTAGGGQQSGTWFHMVQTNGLLARVRLGDSATNFVDNVVVTNRALRWAGSGFLESLVNDGTMDTGTSVIVT